MLIAIPLDASYRIYHDNPSTAPQYALYTIEGERSKLICALQKTVANPWIKGNQERMNDNEVCACACTKERAEDIHHMAEHYIMLEAIKGCNYLLAGTYCRNTVRALRNGGVKVYKIPPFIHNTDKAIKNFLIGENFADSLQHIHHES